MQNVCIHERAHAERQHGQALYLLTQHAPATFSSNSSSNSQQQQQQQQETKPTKQGVVVTYMIAGR